MEDFRQVGWCIMNSELPPHIPVAHCPDSRNTHFLRPPQDYSLLQSLLPSLCPVGLPRDCQELFEEGERQSGLFQIQPQGSLPFLVNCRMTSGRMCWPTRLLLSFCQMQPTSLTSIPSFPAEFWGQTSRLSLRAAG